MKTGVNIVSKDRRRGGGCRRGISERGKEGEEKGGGEGRRENKSHKKGVKYINGEDVGEDVRMLVKGGLRGNSRWVERIVINIGVVRGGEEW